MQRMAVLMHRWRLTFLDYTDILIREYIKRRDDVSMLTTEGIN